MRGRLAGLVAAIGWLAAAPAAPAATLSMSTYFGGSHHDQVKDVAVDATGNVYVTGWTASPDFPVRNPRFGFTGGADEFACEDFGCPDAFVAKFAPGGRSLIYSTYLGGSRLDEGTGIAVDGAGAAYVVGKSNSEPGGVFVTKLAPDGSAVEWTRRIGPTSELTPADVAVDGSGRVYVDHSCFNRWYCDDAFLVRLSEAGDLAYGSLLGGGSQDAGEGVAVDRDGDAWLGGVAYSSDFPVTSGQRAGGDCPAWEYYDNPECSDGFVAEFGATAGAMQQPAASPDGAVPAAAAQDESSEPGRLTVARRGRRVSGRLTGCAPRARLVVERRSAARWRVVRRVRTRVDGRYSVRLPSRAGRYRLRAPCAALRTRVISLR